MFSKLKNQLEMRKDAAAIFNSSLAAVEPGAAVKKHLGIRDNAFRVDDHLGGELCLDRWREQTNDKDQCDNNRIPSGHGITGKGVELGLG